MSEPIITFDPDSGNASFILGTYLKGLCFDFMKNGELVVTAMIRDWTDKGVTVSPWDDYDHTYTRPLITLADGDFDEARYL
jgi:hypothetical protein